MLDNKQILEKKKELEDYTNKNIMLYSGIDNTGIIDIKRNLFNTLQSFKSETSAPTLLKCGVLNICNIV